MEIKKVSILCQRLLAISAVSIHCSVFLTCGH